MSEELKDERTNEELDLLADSTKPTNPPMEMEAKAPEAKTPTPAEEFEFQHNGKAVKGTRDQIIKWAQMGYDRPQFAQKWNQEKAKWDEEKKVYSPYKEIDDFAKQNPEWWKHIQDGWNNRRNAAGANGSVPANGQGAANTTQPAYDPRYSALEQKLAGLEPTLKELMAERKKAKEAEEDAVLSKDIEAMRTAHKDLDWESLDENGKSLEHRVLEHAQATGIPSFRAAFRDLLHDQLVSKAESLSKIAVAKGIQNRTKLGVLGESPTPRGRVPEQNRNIRKTSYEDLMNEAIAEIRQTRT